MNTQPIRIAPSILAADFARLGEEVNAITSADLIHFDVMDNHYVPNLTFGPAMCRALKPYARAPMDVHLMVEPVDTLIEAFIDAGADIISFHPEASKHIDRSLNLIRGAGLKAGLALNPATPIQTIEHVIDKLDVVLIMSVNPGFGGQSLIPSCINKIAQLRHKLDEHHQQTGQYISIEVDGGVNMDNIASLVRAGADTFVAGTAVFGQSDYGQAINGLRQRGSMP